MNAALVWAKVDMRGPLLSPYLGPCWLWRGYCDPKGYGYYDRRDGSTRRAHRIVYELVCGVIPDGLFLDHLCRKPSCVNPAHLEPVTHLENQRRGVGVVGEAARRAIYGSWPELGRPEPMKRCSSCQLEKKITEFPRDRTGRGLLGYGHRCKACESVRKRRYKRERASKLGLPEAGER